ncbi:MAG: N-acetyl-gamma-glutamyl-phosphate reductase [Dehalococcoidia bacterium]
MSTAGILGATGYAGAELARLLYRHPQVRLTSVASVDGVGQRLGDYYPHLYPYDLTIKEELDEVDIVLAALPHAVAAKLLLPRIDSGMRVIDLSADFRLKDAAEYERWYQTQHPRPQLLKEAVYGLPELHRKEIAGARLVANPGCYPTGAILALAPAVKAGLIEKNVVVDSKSGTSGAGRSLMLGTMLSEAGEGISAYGLAGHRHLPEIVQELSLVGDAPCRVTFVPHLLPMVRGILTTAYASLSRESTTANDVREAYREFYKDEPFVRVVDSPPQTKHTRGSNFCAIHPTVDERTGRLVVVSCLDNLVKGAAGQAIQNMNLMLGLPERAGLEELSLYP